MPKHNYAPYLSILHTWLEAGVSDIIGSRHGLACLLQLLAVCAYIGPAEQPLHKVPPL